ncbi:conserved protein of unknown function [Georgfuchsia toluolica]|uniref:DUF2523 domain-containing protein n=1 Tax=Georgfuchsia toluolica TaxID=424218 RepID=A0A916J2I4_9PROT|nr:DUF2523 domain-containing protein [Georgfuchsia toluolica]CAG4882794.1 conserved protein of unknown function [Georgfuchsia toluolica]
MSDVGTFLIAIAVPIVKRVLIALGIGLITYGTYSVAVDQVRSAVLTQWGSLGSATAAILSLGGVGESLGIILGALASRAALMAAARFGKLAS